MGEDFTFLLEKGKMCESLGGKEGRRQFADAVALSDAKSVSL